LEINCRKVGQAVNGWSRDILDKFTPFQAGRMCRWSSKVR
jgi:hypothetical protein